MAAFVSRTIRKITGRFKQFWIIFLTGFGTAILCFVVLNAATRPFETSEYCGTACHEMQSLYEGWKLSEHYVNSTGVVVDCVDCHLPPKDKYLTHLSAKLCVGVRDLYKHYFVKSYDDNKQREKVLMEMPDERCTRCHSNLLARPSSVAARIAHKVPAEPADVNIPRCVECHSQLHKRGNETPLPD